MQTLQNYVLDILHRLELHNNDTITTGLILFELQKNGIIATRSQVQRILNRFATRGYYKGASIDRVTIKFTQYNGSYIVSW